MLTKAQVVITTDWLRADVRGREHQPEALYLRVACDALAAYSRVVALLESKCSIYTADELRRALEG